MMDRITALTSAKAKDIIAPKIKAECRIDEHGVLWVETKQWEKVNRVIVREKDSIFCKMFEIPIEEVEP